MGSQYERETTRSKTIFHTKILYPIYFQLPTSQKNFLPQQIPTNLSQFSTKSPCQKYFYNPKRAMTHNIFISTPTSCRGAGATLRSWLLSRKMSVGCIGEKIFSKYFFAYRRLGSRHFHVSCPQNIFGHSTVLACI